MYPQKDLTELARAKDERRRLIACHRMQCTESVSAVAQPLVWFDTALRLWKGLFPLAKLTSWPLVAIAVRTIFPRQKTLHALVRWAPPVASAIITFRQMRCQWRTRPEGVLTTDIRR